MAKRKVTKAKSKDYSTIRGDDKKLEPMKPIPPKDFGPLPEYKKRKPKPGEIPRKGRKKPGEK